MNPTGRPLHLLRNGELIDAVIRSIPPGLVPTVPGCGIELSYLGCRLRAYGVDSAEALAALRGTLAVDGITFNPTGVHATA